MRPALALFVVGFVLLASVAAGPRKVLVLPVGGNAPAAQRTSIDTEILSLAKANMDGDITAGDTTFADTATAVGCSADDAECAQTVIKTLSVDELVYGTATTENGTTTVTVHRVAKGEAARDQVTTLTETSTSEETNAGMQPLFSRTPVEPEVGSGSGSGSAVVVERPRPKSFFDSRERKLGVGLGAAGVACLVVGFSLWSGAGRLQQQTDGHPTTSLAQLRDLHDLEDRAGSKALWGNVFVLLGVGLTGTGAYYLYTDHKNRSTVVTPAPTDGGAQVVIRGRW
jgi:hypothetical protein